MKVVALLLIALCACAAAVEVADVAAVEIAEVDEAEAADVEEVEIEAEEEAEIETEEKTGEELDIENMSQEELIAALRAEDGGEGEEFLEQTEGEKYIFGRYGCCTTNLVARAGGLMTGYWGDKTDTANCVRSPWIYTKFLDDSGLFKRSWNGKLINDACFNHDKCLWQCRGHGNYGYPISVFKSGGHCDIMAFGAAIGYPKLQQYFTGWYRNRRIRAGFKMVRANAIARGMYPSAGRWWRGPSYKVVNKGKCIRPKSNRFIAIDLSRRRRRRRYVDNTRRRRRRTDNSRRRASAQTNKYSRG